MTADARPSQAQTLRAKAEQSTVIAAELRARASREDEKAKSYLAQIEATTEASS